MAILALGSAPGAGDDARTDPLRVVADGDRGQRLRVGLRRVPHVSFVENDPGTGPSGPAAADIHHVTASPHLRRRLRAGTRGTGAGTLPSGRDGLG